MCVCMCICVCVYVYIHACIMERHIIDGMAKRFMLHEKSCVPPNLRFRQGHLLYDI